MASKPPNPLYQMDSVWKKAAGPTKRTPNPKSSTPVQVAGTSETYPSKQAYKAAQNKKLKKKYPTSKIPKGKI